MPAVWELGSMVDFFVAQQWKSKALTSLVGSSKRQERQRLVTTAKKVLRLFICFLGSDPMPFS